MTREKVNEDDIQPLHHSKLDLSPSFFSEMSQKTRRKLSEVLFKDGLSINKVNMTSVDLFSLPRGISDEDLMKIIQAKLEVNNLEDQEILALIQTCFQEAKDHIQNYLHIQLPSTVANFQINSPRDIIRFLQNTRAFNPRDGIGLGPSYCALASCFLAAWESHKKAFQMLINQSNYLNDQLFTVSDETGVQHFQNSHDGQDGSINICMNPNGQSKWIRAGLSYRGKSFDSIMSKLIREPEFSAEKIITDGIAFTITVSNKEEAQAVILFLVDYLQDNYDTSDLKFKNNNLFNPSTQKNICEQLEEKDIILNTSPNPISDQNFKASKVSGRIQVPKNGSADDLVVSSPFEIQVILENNQNQNGMAKHPAYTGRKKLSETTRLYGPFSEAYLNLICQEAADKTGMSADKIKQRYINEDLYLIQKRGRSASYASREHINRWIQAGSLPDDVRIKNTGLSKDITSNDWMKPEELKAVLETKANLKKKEAMEAEEALKAEAA